MTHPTDPSFFQKRSRRAAIGVTFTFACLVVLLSYLTEGRTLATRTATSMVMPVGLAWLGAMAFCLCYAFRRFWSASVGFGLLSLLVFVTGNGYVTSTLMSYLEWPEVTLSASADEPLRTAIVLGGGVMISPKGTPELNDDGERIFSADQLWQAGLVSSIICTGATPDGRFNPSDVGRDLLLSAGVPDEALFVVGGENTTEEMRELRKFLDNPPPKFPPNGRIALITSAFHMKRAMRLAKVQELDFEPYPCAFRTGIQEGFHPSLWVPSAGTMSDFSLALKEYLAVIVGR